MAISAGEIELIFRMRDEASAQMAAALQKIDMAGMNIGMRMQSLGAGLTMALTVPIAGLGIGVTKFASDFESSFAGVRKTVNATEEEFAQFAQGFRDLSKEIPINVNELNKIGEAAGQLGIENENIVEFSEVMAKLGVTTRLSSEQAATSLARLANITQMPQKEFDRLGSTVVALGNEFATYEDEIVDFGLRIAGAGKIAGISEAGILAIGTAMSSVGVQAEAGGTAVQKVLIEMVKASAQGAEGFKTFAKTAGMSAQEFATLFEKDAATAFRMFIEGLGREGKNAVKILAELGLEDQRLVRSFLALSGAGDLLERTLGEANTAWRENTALTEEARKRFETTESKLTVLWNRIKDVGITLGKALLPMIKQAIGALDGLIPIIEKAGQLFVALPTPVKLLAIGLGLVLAAAGPLIYALGQLVMAAGALSGLMAIGLNPALAASAGHHHAAAAGATAHGASATTASLGVKALTLAIGKLSIALVGVYAAYKIVEQVSGLFADQSKRAAGEDIENARRLEMRAQAADIAGRAILSYDEAVEIVTKHLREEAAAQQGATVYTGAAGPAVAAAAKASHDYAAELASVTAKVKALDPATRAQLNAAIKLGVETEELTREFGLSERELTIYGAVLSDTEAATKKAAAADKKLAEELKKLNAEIRAFGRDASGAFGAELMLASGALGKLEKAVGNAPPLFSKFNTVLGANILQFNEVTLGWAKANGLLDQMPAKLQTVGGSIKANLSDVLANIPQLLTQAFTGGGGILGALKALGVQIAEAIAKPIFDAISSAITKAIAGKAIGNAVGGAAGGAAAGGAGISAATAGALGFFALGAFIAFQGQQSVKKMREVRALLQKEWERLAAEIQQKTEAMWALGMNEWITRDRGTGLEDWIAFQQELLTEFARRVDEANTRFAPLLQSARELGIRLPESLLLSIQQLRDLGILTEANAALLDTLAGAATVDWRKMQEAAERYKIPVDNLGKVFNQLRITDAATQIINDFDLMTRGGASVGAVLSGMQEEISALVIESMKLGTELPANMRPWIEELIRAGKLTDENGNVLTDLAELQFGVPIETKFEAIVTAIQELIAVLKGPLTDALKNLPAPNLQIPTGDDWLPPLLPGTRHTPIPEFAGGSGGQLIDFGRESLVRLHGRERIQTEAEMRGGGRISAPLQIMIGHKVLADAVIDVVGNRISLRGANA